MKNDTGILQKRRLLKFGKSGLRANTYVKDALFIVCGIFGAAFGLESFLLPNRFIDGGATGISLLVTEVTAIPLSLLIVVVNIPFLIMGYRVIGQQFAIKALLAILGLALVLAAIDFPEVTQDKLLVAVFGGFFLGAGIGLSIRGGGVLDGTEVLAIFLSRKLGIKIGDVIIVINIFIFLAAAYLLSIEAALYSMLTYLAASKTLDFVVDGIEEYTGVTIISSKSEEVRLMVTEKLGRGLTIYKATGGYGKQGEHNQYDVIYTVITRLEIRKLTTELDKIDPKAFTVMSSINDTRGGMIKKRAI
ncbi:YitT family protein [uncultured Croceitalea sp.]|uniref:YitT family protein n=1 Tax=uncultured Croceitalea sp. TaxID=1798908 RepID=UPI00330608A7